METGLLIGHEQRN